MVAFVHACLAHVPPKPAVLTRLATPGILRARLGCRQADSGGVSRVTDGHLGTRAGWPQPVIPKTGNRKETTMNSALHYELMQARHHDLMKSAARDRLAAQAKAARVAARRDNGTVAPRRRVLQRMWRLLPV